MIQLCENTLTGQRELDSVDRAYCCHPRYPVPKHFM